jgi:hypothetical protein
MLPLCQTLRWSIQPWRAGFATGRPMSAARPVGPPTVLAAAGLAPAVSLSFGAAWSRLEGSDWKAPLCADLAAAAAAWVSARFWASMSAAAFSAAIFASA